MATPPCLRSPIRMELLPFLEHHRDAGASHRLPSVPLFRFSLLPDIRMIELDHVAARRRTNDVPGARYRDRHIYALMPHIISQPQEPGIKPS